jgi:hypothetical protein
MIFSEFLVACWNKTPRTHQYQIPERRVAWRKFNRGEMTWTVESLKDACEKYFWRDDFASTFRELTTLRGQLGNALNIGSERDAGELVHEIFRWGGVGRGKNLDWVKESVNSHSLCTSIKDAVRLLKNREGNLDRFGGFEPGLLPMNSSMTKVYAAADPQEFLIIYDGRVGAALAHLARLFLEQQKAPNVPPELNYHWGTSRSAATSARDPRNPSTAQYSFPRLFGPSPDFHHATDARRASFLISKCARACEVSPRSFEAALFMWGYRAA